MADIALSTLAIQKVPVAPNIVYVPMVLIQTGIMGGKLQTSYQLHLSAAKLTDPGLKSESLVPTGQSGMIHIAPGETVEPGVAEALDKAYADIVAVVRTINAARKIL